MAQRATAGISSGVRLIVVASSLAVGVLFIGFMWLAVPPGAQHFLMDKPTPQMEERFDEIEAKIQERFDDPDRSLVRFPFPFTIQNVMWLVFFLGLGQLSLRFVDGARETAQMGRGYLPEDERTILRSEDLAPIFNRVRHAPGSATQFLPRLIHRVLLQFQLTRSVDQANALLNSSLELYLHEIDLRYNILRYIMWLIPSLGFIGTVIGIALALNIAGQVSSQDPQLLSILADQLGVAFYTTLLALLQAAVLVALMHIAQGREERALNDAGQYCLDNLINRLYER